MLGNPVNRRANVYVLAFQENAIGSGGGYYNNQALFKSREGHGSFVPLCGLLKAEDYEVLIILLFFLHRVSYIKEAQNDCCELPDVIIRKASCYCSKMPNSTYLPRSMRISQNLFRVLIFSSDGYAILYKIMKLFLNIKSSLAHFDKKQSNKGIFFSKDRCCNVQILHPFLFKGGK